jgi:hypothetical protein
MNFDNYVPQYIKGDHRGNQHRAQVARDLFKRDLGKEYGWEGKRLDILFDYAWQEGHAYGLVEVDSHFRTLSDMMREFLAAG